MSDSLDDLVGAGVTIMGAGLIFKMASSVFDSMETPRGSFKKKVSRKLKGRGRKPRDWQFGNYSNIWGY